MANKAQDLGQKFTCFKCECKFYDLGSPEPLCPRCGADQREDLSSAPAPPKRKRRGTAVAKVKATPPAPQEFDLGDDDLLDDDFGAEPPTASDQPEPAAKKPAKKAAAKKAPAKKAAAKKAPAKKAAAKK